MDKRRRDMKRNPEPWWQQLYDENGEIGAQAAEKNVETSLLDSIKFTIFGDSKLKA